MAIEYEKKFILNQRFEEQEQRVAADPRFHRYEILQVYLSRRTRIRMRISDAGTEYFHTVKYDLGPGRCVEIEPSIPAHEFDLLRLHHGEREVVKTRYRAVIDGFDWVVDFLRRDGRTYISLAEVELPPDWTGAEEDIPVLDLLTPYVSYPVPANESKSYTNSKLACPKYASKVLKKLAA
jgi:CYTH domain-containing protein